MYYGAAKSDNPLGNKDLVDRFLDTLSILGIDSVSAQFFGILKANLETAGNRLADADLWIGSIARAHHEKLNGRGYPYNLTAAEIPFQSKMMTVSDIYDALSASDRPYKKAVPTERALDILKMEANQLLIDSDLFRIFTEAGIYKLTANWKHPAGFNL